MSAPYFLVHRVELKGDTALVDGRTGDAKIPQGYVFTRSFDSIDAWRDQQVPSRSGHFALRAIEAYRRPLDELYPGMSARLTLEGADLHALTGARVLA